MAHGRDPEVGPPGPGFPATALGQRAKDCTRGIQFRAAVGGRNCIPRAHTSDSTGANPAISGRAAGTSCRAGGGRVPVATREILPRGCRFRRPAFVTTVSSPVRTRAADKEIIMGKLVVTEFISLDGIVEDPGGAEGTEQGGWSFRHPADEGQEFKGEELERADAQLLGRVTYEGFAAAWPAMEDTAGEFGKKMNAMPKVVVSTTLTEATWNNTTIFSGNRAAGVGRMKGQYQGDILVAGSPP